MFRRNLIFIILIMIVFAALFLVGCSGDKESNSESPAGTGTQEATPDILYTAEEIAAWIPDGVPDLPFENNPDPAVCGRPTPWGMAQSAWLTGMYEGELAQPIVYLYDGHTRNAVVSAVPHGTEVQIVLFQDNPVLNFYMVRIPGVEVPYHEGWIPAPFLSFEPVEALNN